MAVEWVVLVVGILGLAFVLSSASRLASGRRRGTEWRPSERMWLVIGGAAALLAIVGSLGNLIGG